MRQTLLIAVMVLTASGTVALGQKQGARQDPRRSVEQAIRQVDHERIQAQIHADAVALDRIYADDFIGIGPSGTLRTKPQVIADFTSGELRFQSITTDDVRVRVYGNSAVETGRSTMIGQDKGKAVPRDNRFTRVWIKQAGRWRLVSNHYSPLTAEQSTKGTAMKTAKGTFEVKVTPVKDDGTSAIEGIGRLSLNKTWSGDLVGTSKGHMLGSSDAAQTTGGYVAIEVFTGTLNGKKGSFALQHNGTMGGGKFDINVEVVPGSGTDELIGISGKLKIIIAAGKHSYELEYSLPNSK